MFGGLLGKRSTSSHPLGLPTASGRLPGDDDLPGPPAAKIAVQSDLDERFESLSRTIAELSARVVVVDEMQSQITQLKSQLADERQARREVERELTADKASLKRSEERFCKLEKRVVAYETKQGKLPASYADAVGRGEADNLHKSQQEIAGNMSRLQGVVERQERQSRASNVMLFGLADDGQRSAVQQVSACLQAAGIPERDRVVQAVRLPSNRTGSTSRPAPVKVVLQSAADASAMLRHTRTLRQRFQVGLDRDLTPQQTQVRKERQGVVQELRGLGYVTFWRGDQLVYVHKATGKREVYAGRLPGRA